MALKVSLMWNHELDQWFEFGLPRVISPETCPHPNMRIFAASELTDRPSNLSTLLAFAPRSRYLKVTDVATNEIIASARWEFYNFDNYPYSSSRDRRTYRGPKPCRDFPVPTGRRAVIFETRYSVIGVRPHLVLSNLVTLPNHRHRDAARRLIQWGLDMADTQDGVDVYVESTEATVPLYEKFGFQTVAIIPTREVDVAEDEGIRKNIAKVHTLVSRPFEKSSHFGPAFKVCQKICLGGVTIWYRQQQEILSMNLRGRVPQIMFG